GTPLQANRKKRGKKNKGGWILECEVEDREARNASSHHQRYQPEPAGRQNRRGDSEAEQRADHAKRRHRVALLLTVCRLARRDGFTHAIGSFSIGGFYSFRSQVTRLGGTRSACVPQTTNGPNALPIKRAAARPTPPRPQ